MFEYKVSSKENFYFVLKLIFSLLLVVLAANVIFKMPPKILPMISVLFFYGVLIITFFFIQKLILVGHIRNNGIQITGEQFPEIYTIFLEQAGKMGIENPPMFYTIQGGGILNAFATRFVGSNYVVLYSDVLETAYEEGNKAMEFILAHELGHVLRKHMSKNFWLLPSIVVPFLSQAYSRACETTCDNIGTAVCPEGAISGMLILAAGKRLYKKIDTGVLVNNYRRDQSIITWLAEIFSSHPPIPKRVLNITQHIPR